MSDHLVTDMRAATIRFMPDGEHAVDATACWIRPGWVTAEVDGDYTSWPLQRIWAVEWAVEWADGAGS